ncbi:hypothetical protein Lsan_3805 [Legionella santicrucis]|uniref:Uncharacterized protein n=1 Tax=Legionella santicrucis TaxID=45074 RepID=A0A0W0Y9Y9_9GAMM|nr:hypothetical protein [Legionella santicrucis]KTD53395.1 hypothetical protein Lsan_3805 [Legionella santicrucis]
MKDETIIKDEARNYLVELYAIFKNSPLRTENFQQQFKAVTALRDEYKLTQDPKFIEAGYPIAKEFQLALIDLMIDDCSMMVEGEEKDKQAVKNMKVKENSFLKNIFDKVEESVAIFSKSINNSSSESSFKENVMTFNAELAKERKILEEKEPNQAIELAKFKNYIDRYKEILEKKLGNFPIPKAPISVPDPSQLVKVPTSTPSKHKRKIVPKIEVIDGESIYSELKTQAENLALEIDTYHSKIKDKLVAYNASITDLEKQFKEDPLMIKEQIILPIGMEQAELLNLVNLRKETIEETAFLLNARSQPKNAPHDKEAKRKYDERCSELEEKYVREYKSLTNAKLYELLIVQRTKYLSQLKNLDHKIEIVPLKLKLADLSEQCVVQVEAINILSDLFKDKMNALVNDEPQIKELLSQYDSLLKQKDVIFGEMEQMKAKLNHQDALFESKDTSEILRISQWIERTQEVNALDQIIKTLTSLFTNEFAPAMEKAKKDREAYSSLAVLSIKEKINLLKTLEEKCQEPVLNKYVVIDKDRITTSLINADKVIEKLPKLTREEMETNVLNILQELDELITPLTKQIDKIDFLRAEVSNLRSQLATLAEQRQVPNDPLVEIYNNNCDDLDKINNLVIDQERNYNIDNLKSISQCIFKVKNEQERLRQNYIRRSRTAEIQYLNYLIEAVRSIQSNDKQPEWPTLLVNELNDTKSRYLTSKIDLNEFKDESAKALSTHITEKNITALTSNNENKTSVGNFFRAAVEFIIAIWHSITQQEKPLYRPKFFASNGEKEFACKIQGTYQLLMNLQQEQEEQFSIQPQHLISAQA